MEVDPRYDYRSDTWDPNAPLWPPGCGHPACVEDEALHADGGDCEDWVTCPQPHCRYNTAHAMCERDRGHEGEHVFISPAEIVLEFPAQPAPARGDR